MHVRVIALALPLVLGIACTHSRSQRTARTSTTQTAGSQASTSPKDSAAPGTTTGSAQPAPSRPDTGQTTNEPSTSREPTASSLPPGNDTGSTASAQSDRATGQTTDTAPRESTAGAPSQPGTETGTSRPLPGETGSSSTMGGSASSSGSARSQDPIIEQGDPVKGHAEDHVVSGKIARVSRRFVVIQSDSGDQSTLFFAPQTTIQVDGQDAHRTDLKEGQDVRASFDEQNGRNVAVKVRAGKGATGKAPSPDDPTWKGPSNSPNQGSSTSQGSSSQLDTGGTSSGSTSSPDAGSSGSAHPRH